MSIVVDANILVAAFIKSSTIRKILLHDSFTFVSPDFILEEIYKYRPLICKKARITTDEFSMIATLIFTKIRIIPSQEYRRFLSEAQRIMSNDIKDAPYIACALSQQSEGIWTNDKHFQNKLVPIISTNELWQKLH